MHVPTVHIDEKEILDLLLLRLLALDCQQVLDKTIGTRTRNDPARDSGLEGLLDLLRCSHILDGNQRLSDSTKS